MLYPIGYRSQDLSTSLAERLLGNHAAIVAARAKFRQNLALLTLAALERAGDDADEARVNVGANHQRAASRSGIWPTQRRQMVAVRD
jgi:hypothetical protein